EPELAELLDRGRNLVTRLEPDLLILRLAGNDALRRAGEDDVARLERHVFRDVADQLLAVEHHVAGVRGLHHVAVDVAFDLEIVAVDLIGGDEPRPDRPGPVERLAEHPLARTRLQVARGEIIAGAIAEDVFWR